MQLKRDTDFAIRILYCLKQKSKATDPSGAGGLTLNEIAAQTGAPKTAVGRLCEKLEEKGIIDLCCEPKAPEKAYCAGPHLLDQSFLSVINAVEGTGELFAVFDKRTAAYSCSETQIQRIQKSIEKILTETTLRRLFREKTSQNKQ